MKKFILTAAFLAFVALSVNAQNQIRLINGKVIDAKTYHIGDMYINYQKQKGGVRLVDKYDVFSIVKSDSSETVIYQPADSLDFTVDQARQYIMGQQAARLYYNKPANAISSAIVGAGSSILIFYAFPIPMIYGIAMGRFNTHHYQVPENFDKNLVKTEAFQFGYQKGARNIKIQQCLKWGYIGLGAGITTLLIWGNANRVDK